MVEGWRGALLEGPLRALVERSRAPVKGLQVAALVLLVQGQGCQGDLQHKSFVSMI